MTATPEQERTPMPDQDAVVAFLSTPAAYGRPGVSIDRIDTHISVVWLVGERAYKLKRAVRFDYVDFSTMERRRQACEAEVTLNRRTAPALYLGVCAVTREADGTLALGGQGTPIEWLVEMARFDQETLFDRLAARGRLDIALMEGLADAIVRLHAVADVRTDHGGHDGMAWVIDGNAHGFADEGAEILDQAACAELTTQAREALERSRELLENRRRRGFVKTCHGDLHLRNICLVDGAPTLFDSVEFNEEISCVDVLYDLAFLLMDLWHRDLRSHANVVFNEYLARTSDFEGMRLLPLFLSCRAAVRAKTSAAAARVQRDDRQRGELESAAREYLALAAALLRPSSPGVVAIGGFSGSGKSTLARRLAPGIGAAPGAVILRSDVIRKALLGVSPTTRLGAEGYGREVTERVYRTLVDRARATVAAGQVAIVDAVYAAPEEREAIAVAAREARVPFLGFWLDGPRDVLSRRVRLRATDASDATEEIVERQLEMDIGRLDWERLDASLDADAVQQRAETRCRDAVYLK